MDSRQFPTERSPRKELQGPRPTPLRIQRDSHKIRKQTQQPQVQPRQPVIIYTVSPKVIHTSPRDFMSLVQRLTGLSSTAAAASSTSSFPYASSSLVASSSLQANPTQENYAEGVSPAARYATIEKARTASELGKKEVGEKDASVFGGMVERPVGSLPGILSPAPASLPPFPSSFFSPPAEPSPFSFFPDLSPLIQGNRSFMEGSFMPGPPNFISPNNASPTSSIDLFNNFPEF